MLIDAAGLCLPRQSQLHTADALGRSSLEGGWQTRVVVWKREFQLALNRAIPLWVEGISGVQTELFPVHSAGAVLESLP